MDMSTDKLVRDLKAVVTDTQDLLKATAGQGDEQIAQIRARAEESLRAVRERIQDLPDIEAQVRDHPWTALGVAAGIGLVAGVLLARK